MERRRIVCGHTTGLLSTPPVTDSGAAALERKDAFDYTYRVPVRVQIGSHKQPYDSTAIGGVLARAHSLTRSQRFD